VWMAAFQQKTLIFEDIYDTKAKIVYVQHDQLFTKFTVTATDFEQDIEIPMLELSTNHGTKRKNKFEENKSKKIKVGGIAS
jgi:hypothetical protein